MTSYVLLEDNPVDPIKMKKGTIVYDCKRYDYGCSRDDTRHFREEYISVTLDPKGGGSFCTCPKRILEALT